MKKICWGVIIASVLSASSAFALGKAQTPLTLVLNPYVMALQKEFAGAIKPATKVPGDIAQGIQLGKRYDCRTFYALSQKNVSTPDTAAIWYRFQKYGDLFLDNIAIVDIGRIKSFAANTQLANELLGESDDHLYFEALRVTPSGDLIIEGSTLPQAWAKMILGFLGLNSAIPEIANQIGGLELASAVAASETLVLSYTYCPHDHITAESTLDRILAQ